MNQQVSDGLRNTPAAWRASALRQLEAIAVMKRGTLHSNESEYHSALSCCMMLAGFAFEAAFKCWYLEEGNLLYTTGKLAKELKSHSFIDWVRDSGISLHGWEEESLSKAQFYCVAWGRYPFHKNPNQERPYEACGMGDVEQIENLIGRLLNGHSA